MVNVLRNWSWKPDGRTIRRIRDGNRKCRRPELPANRIEEMKMETNTETSSSGSNGATAPARKASKKAVKKIVKKATKVVKAVDTDRIALKTICQKLDVDPRLARRKLRKANISGHSEKDRWTFKKDSTAYEKALETLKAA